MFGASTQHTHMKTFEFSQDVETLLESFTLADLLHSPATQPWFVSMVFNALRNGTVLPKDDHDSYELIYALNLLATNIPDSDRIELFQYVKDNVRERNTKSRKNTEVVRCDVRA